MHGFCQIKLVCYSTYHLQVVEDARMQAKLAKPTRASARGSLKDKKVVEFKVDGTFHSK